MADKGEWEQEDYIFGKRKETNMVRKRQIEIAKHLINKEEFLLKISEIDLIVDTLNGKIDKSQDAIKWMETKING